MGWYEEETMADEEEARYVPRPLNWSGCMPALAVALLLIATWLAALWLGAGGALGPAG